MRELIELYRLLDSGKQREFIEMLKREYLAQREVAELLSESWPDVDESIRSEIKAYRLELHAVEQGENIWSIRHYRRWKKGEVEERRWGYGKDNGGRNQKES